MVNLKFEKLVERAKIPFYQYEGDSGFDLSCIEDFYIDPNQTMFVSTGLIVEIPEEYEIQVRSRSGLALKQSVIVLNSPGTVDSNYRGEIKVILKNLGNSRVVFKAGDRIAQGVLCPVIYAKISEGTVNLNTNRNIHGFGSTGLKVEATDIIKEKAE
jgi:dUTP pyrophosphatase